MKEGVGIVGVEGDVGLLSLGALRRGDDIVGGSVGSKGSLGGSVGSKGSLGGSVGSKGVVEQTTGGSVRDTDRLGTSVGVIATFGFRTGEGLAVGKGSETRPHAKSPHAISEEREGI